jgi:hypothetical protein
MALKPIVHEVRIQNQVIFLDPPIESARQTWLQQLHDWLGECCPDYYPWFGSHGMSFSRCGLQVTADSKFEIRNWASNAGQHGIGSVVYLVGE